MLKNRGVPLAILLQLPSHLVLQPRALKLSVVRTCRVPHAENCGRVCRSLEEFRKSKNEKSFLTFSYESLFIVGCALISISVIRRFSKRINQPFKRHCCHFISFLHPACVTMDGFLQPSDRFDCYKYQAYVI